MEPFVLLIVLSLAGLLFFFWHQRKMWKEITKTDEGDEGFTIAQEVVEKTFHEKTEDIDQALNATDPEGQLADMINRRSGPL